MVLDADDLADLSAFSDLGGGDVADADVVNQALALEVAKCGEGGHERAFGRGVAWHAAEVDDLKGVEAQVAEIVVDGGGEVVGGEGRVPRAFRAAVGGEALRFE